MKGSVVSHALKVLFIETEVMAKLVQDGDANFMGDRIFTANNLSLIVVMRNPSPGMLEDSLAENMDALGQASLVAHGPLNQRGAAVQAAERVIVRVEAKLLEELP